MKCSAKALDVSKNTVQRLTQETDGEKPAPPLKKIRKKLKMVDLSISNNIEFRQQIYANLPMTMNSLKLHLEEGFTTPVY